MLTNIAKSKGSQAMEFGQLIEYNMRNFPKNRTQNVLVKPFSKKSKSSVSLDQLSNVLYSLFLLYAKLGAIEIYWN